MTYNPQKETQNLAPAVTMTLAGLNSLAASATVGVISERIDFTKTKATDYYFNLKLVYGAGASSGDKCAYIFFVPWLFDGTNWFPNSQGTTILPAATAGSTTIAAINSLILVDVIPHVASAAVNSGFWLSDIMKSMPHGGSIIIINNTGNTTSASGNCLIYSPTFKILI